MVAATLPPSNWLVNQLTTARVFDVNQLAPYLSEFQSQHRSNTAAVLGQYLVSTGLLSQYQVDLALRGEASKLVMGNYLLVNPVGSGSLGTVYEAMGRADRKRYAVKVLPLRSLWNVQLAKKQLAVFHALPAHPAILPFLDIDSAAGSHYLVWPFCRGQTLRAFVEQNRAMGVADTITIMSQVAEAMAICHTHDIIHGVLSPMNILLGVDGQTRILDLGAGALLSENLAEDESMLDTISTANAAMNLVECCAPETLHSPTLREKAGDLYSFGCVLYYALAGELPFPEGNTISKIIAHQTQPAPDIRAKNPDVPPWLALLIQQLLAKLPEQRPANFEAVLEAFRMARTTFGSQARTPSTTPLSEPQPETSRKSIPSSIRPDARDSKHDGVRETAATTASIRVTATPTPARPPLTAPSASVSRYEGGPVSVSEIDFSEFERPIQSSDPLLSQSPSSIPELPPVTESVLARRIVLSKPKSSVTSIRSTHRPAPPIDPSLVEETPPQPIAYTTTNEQQHLPHEQLAQQLGVVPQIREFAETWWVRLKQKIQSWFGIRRDRVQLSVFGPTEVAPGESTRLQVFAHQPEDFDNVYTTSRVFSKECELLATGYINHEVMRGTEVGVHLKVGNAGVAVSLLTLNWHGQPNPLRFDVHVPWESPSGWTPALLSAGIQGILCGSVSFQILILPRKG